MSKKPLFSILTVAALAAILACDQTVAGDASDLGTECPIGTFRPTGAEDCVFPAEDQFGNSLGVSDNRCATGQPAVPPACVSDTGARPYFSTVRACAPGYRFAPGSCLRNSTGGGISEAGTSGSFGTAGILGTAGFFETAGTGQAAGDSGFAGSDFNTGAAGFNTGAAGSTAAGGQ